MKLINIGFGNLINSSRIITLVSPDSAHIKRIFQDSKQKNMLIDATFGRRCKAVIVTDSDHVVLSAISPETIGNRLEDEEVE